MGVPSPLELVNVIGSDLTDFDEYIKEHLLDTDLPSINKIKICLYYYITEQPFTNFYLLLAT